MDRFDWCGGVACTGPECDSPICVVQMRALRSLARVSRLSSRVLLSAAPRAVALRSPATAISAVCGLALSSRFLATSAGASGTDEQIGW
jgi:hypothetical protein